MENFSILLLASRKASCSAAHRGFPVPWGRAETKHCFCTPSSVLTCLYSSLLTKQAAKKAAAMTSGSGLLKSNKENSRKSLMNSKSASTLLIWNKKSKRSKNSTYSIPFTAVGDNEAMY